MKHDRQLALLNRLIERRVNGDRHIVTDEVSHLPVDLYTSQEIFDREMATIFADYPLIVGHVDSVREPGSYMLGDWKRYPFVVVRQRDGTLRAFWNTCRHRGSTLVKSETGKPLSSFVCPFHGWTYDLDGRLQAIPRSFGFPGLDKKKYGLSEVPVKESMGFVWVWPKHSDSFDPVAFTGSFAEDIEHFGLGRFSRYKKVVTEIKANWKLLVQSSLEAYHVPALHKATIAKDLENGVLVYDVDGPQLRICVGRSKLLEAIQVPEEERNILDYVGILYVVFPNVIIRLYHSYFWIKCFFPLAPDRTLWRQEFLYLPDRFDGEKGRRSLKSLYTFFHEVVFSLEDYPVLEGIQTNLLNGVNETHTLGREEGLVSVFQDIVSSRMRWTAGV